MEKAASHSFIPFYHLARRILTLLCAQRLKEGLVLNDDLDHITSSIRIWVEYWRGGRIGPLRRCNGLRCRKGVRGKMGGSDKSKEHKSIFKERELRLWLKLSPKYMSVIANNVSVDNMTLPAIDFFAASQETRHLSRKNIYP